jgi:hypothetical protein
MNKIKKPAVKLIGEDGNAFCIMAACLSAARSAGWEGDQIGALTKEMMSGDYTNLLAVAAAHFDVE